MSLEKRLRFLERAWQERSPQDAAGRPEPGEAEPFSTEQGWEPAGRFVMRRRLHYPSSLSRVAFSEFLLPSGYQNRDLLFFDTETTGLSGGAGNSVFLVGTAWIEEKSLAVEQLFLKDFPGEGEFLPLVAERLGQHRVFVSYNGRAFDAHLLRTRFLLNRMQLELEQHTDLLYWARRLWRRSLPDCSLGTVEREILGIRRELDVSGFEVPGIYLEFLRSGRPGQLDAVLEHNLQDVRSLAELLLTVNAILCSREPLAVSADRTALGNFYLSRDQRWGAELLKSAFEGGDEAAGRALSLFYKRAGAWGDAVRIWRQLSEQRRSLFAAVELAKYFEHRQKDAESALHWVQAALSWGLPLDARLRAQLQHRRKRLLGKQKRAGFRS